MSEMTRLYLHHNLLVFVALPPPDKRPATCFRFLLDEPPDLAALELALALGVNRRVP